MRAVQAMLLCALVALQAWPELSCQVPRLPRSCPGWLAVQVMDTLALNCSPAIRAQLAGKSFLQRAASLAGDRKQDGCAQASLQLLVDWAFIYKCARAGSAAKGSAAAGSLICSTCTAGRRMRGTLASAVGAHARGPGQAARPCQRLPC